MVGEAETFSLTRPVEFDIQSSYAISATDIDADAYLKKRMAELIDLPDGSIDTSDIAEANETFFRATKLRQPKTVTQTSQTPSGQEEPRPKPR